MKNKAITAIFTLLTVYATLFCAFITVQAAGEYQSKEVMWSREFESGCYGYERSASSSVRISEDNGMMIVDYVNSSPYMEGDGFSVPAAGITEVVFAAQSEVDVTYKFFYTTSEAGSWSEDRAFYVKIKGGDPMREYRIDPTANKNWKGDIKRLRIDYKHDGANKDNIVKTDYIRFLGKDIPSVTDYDNCFKFELNTNGAVDGIGVNEGIGEATLASGVLSGNILSQNARIYTNGLEGFSAGEYGSIVLKYRNATPSEKAVLSFKTDMGEGRIEFDVVADDNEIREYIINPGMNKLWNGNVMYLALDFGASSGSFELDEIAIYKYPYTISDKDDKLTISGQLSADDIISVQIMKSEAEDNIEDFIQNGAYIDAVVYTDESFSDSEGRFSFVYEPERMEEAQSFMVMIADSEHLYVSRISYVDSGYAERIRVSINNAIEAEKYDEIYNIVKKAYPYLEISSEGYYDLLTKDIGVYVFAKQMISSGQAQDMEEMEKNISISSMFALFMAIDDKDVVFMAEKYAAQTGLSELLVYGIYSELTPDEKKTILVSSRSDAENIDEYKSNFSQNCILLGIKFNMGAVSVRKIIEDNASVIGIDISKANALKSPDKVYILLAGKEYASFAELINAYEAGVKQVKDNENTSIKPGNSSGGGGGGGAISAKKPTLTAGLSSMSDNTEREEFSDLSDHWAKDSVLALYNKGIVSGKGNGIYAPDDFVKREEFVKMVVMALNIEDNEAIDFTDVSENAWYYSYICSAVKHGLVNGNGDGSFGVGANITRQDMSVIIVRAISDRLIYDYTGEFTDKDEISDYAMESVNALAGAGIINGKDNGKFEPKANATRAETAVMIERMLAYIGG